MELVADIEKIGDVAVALERTTRRRARRPDVPGIAPPRMDHMLDQRRGGRRARRSSSWTCSASGSPSRCSTATATSSGAWLERSPLPARHRDRQRAQRRAAPLRVLARRLGPRPRGGRHPRLQRHPDRPRPDPPRDHPRQHHLLLRPARHPQRGVHRRLPPRPRLPDHHLDRGQLRPSHLLLRGRAQRPLPEGAHLMTGSCACSTSRSASRTSSWPPPTTPRSWA